MKRLKLRIAKFNKLLVVEQLEMKGKFEESENVKVNGDISLLSEQIDLSEGAPYNTVDTYSFPDNSKRDEYTEKLTNWITEEQFGSKLEIGKPCLVSDDNDKWRKNYLLAVLPENKANRYIACMDIANDRWITWQFAKPLNENPKIDGEIYTWESEE